jgi:hypothetical protein
VHDAQEIDHQNAAPLLHILFGRDGLAIASDSGDVAQNINATELLDNRSYALLDSAFVAHIDDMPSDGSFPCKTRRRLIQRLAIPIDEYNSGAFARQALRSGVPDAARSPCNERNSVVETHLIPSNVRCGPSADRSVTTEESAVKEIELNSALQN